MTMHAGQLDLSVDTVRALVGRQFPQWRALELRPVPSPGTVNAVFRLGERLAVRLRLVGDDPSLVRAELEAEAAAMAEFAVVSPAPTPEPVAIGDPGAGFALSWSVQTWVKGHDATQEDPADSHSFAADLAHLVAALRAAPTLGRGFDGRGRGGSLPDHDAWLAECFARSEGLLDVDRLRALWSELRRLPEADETVMSHRDLTPPNLLVEQGRLAGVLDTGGFGPADAALDLIVAWHLLADGPRATFRSELAPTDLQWDRGRAWALQQAMGLVWYYAESNPTMSAWGRRTLGRLVASE